jgi:hypothetical protein
MIDRPAANLVIQVEQAGLVGYFVARLGGNQTARRCWRNWRLLIAGTLAQEAAGTDGHDLRAIMLGLTRLLCGMGAGSGVGGGMARRATCSSFGLATAPLFAGGFFAFGAGFAPFFAAGLALTGEGRDFRPRRCALPITALRLTPPSSSAIWLAVRPFSHIFFSESIRSSVQAMQSPNHLRVVAI